MEMLLILKISIIIVGIIALVDCLGPYVLKGRTILIGNLKDLKNDKAKWSAAILLAA